MLECLSMNRPLLLLFFVSFYMLSTPTDAAVEHANGWSGLDGNAMLPACQAAIELADGKKLSDSRAADAIRCLGYVTGFLDGFGARDNAPGSSAVLCFPEGVNSFQMVRVVTKWLQDHPARLHEPAWSCVFAAVHEGFACQPATKSP